jgi:hypothetical protein
MAHAGFQLRDSREGGPPTVARFGDTHWSVILSAMDKQRPADAANARERLCRVYWPPLYAYVRRWEKARTTRRI